ncbi:MAG: hypothetical protein JWQ64_2385 [Subtercola sp.]|nr:hypothetical protein [Subtercola sp.]
MGLIASYRKSAHEIEHLRKLALIKGNRPTSPAAATPHRALQLTPVEIDELVWKYQAGESMKALARQFGLHRTTIAGHLNRRGVELRDVTISGHRVDQAVALYESGLSLANIGKKLGFTDGTIHTHLKRRGMRMRPAHQKHPS